MAAISTIIAGVGLAAGIGGTIAQVSGQRRAAKAAEQAETLREAQMNLENTRQQRQIRRQAIIAAATATSNAATQGAMDSSAVGGAIGQIQGQAGSAAVASNQNTAIGSSMFDVNRRIASANSQASFGAGISSLGGALVQNSETLGRIGNYAFGIRGV